MTAREPPEVESLTNDRVEPMVVNSEVMDNPPRLFKRETALNNHLEGVAPDDVGAYRVDHVILVSIYNLDCLREL